MSVRDRRRGGGTSTPSFGIIGRADGSAVRLDAPTEAGAQEGRDVCR